MDSIKSKVSYISGLMDGLKIDKNTNEGRILLEVLDVLKNMAEEIENISEAQKHTEDYMDAIDENLAYLQDDLYDENYETYKDMEGNFEEVKCPNCDDTVYVDKDILSQRESLTCPNCHSNISLKDIHANCDKPSDS
ncbi:CD1247 N-terminal domain-containing protein [Clostridium sp. Mt-5]|uniref:CD1247 N-terminal domain-containing protein n=1 Tax=Clostridium moutaii TaxID=3240932 RepID=A0ABV4BKX5_9CLOT